MRRGTVGLLIVVNVALRAWFFHLENRGLTLETLGNPDEQNYLTYARELLRTGPSWLFTERSLSGPPGHVLYLAAVGGSIPLAKALSVVVSAFTILPVLAIARRLSVGPTASRVPALAAVAFTLSLPLIRVGPTLLTEPPTTFLVTAALAMALRAGDAGLSERARLRRWGYAGALLGSATLFRMSTLLLPVWLTVLAAVVTWPPVRRRFGADVPPVRGLAAFTVSAFLVVTPFIAKNGICFGHWKLGTGSGALLYLGADPKTDGHEPFFSQYNFDTTEVTGDYTHVQPQGDARLTRVARHELARAPLPVIARRWKWPLRLFVGEPSDVFLPADSLESSFRMFGAREAAFSLWGLTWRVMIVLFGTAQLATRWRTFPGFILAGTLVYVVVALLPFFVVPRYSIPFLPFIAAAAAAWFENRRLTSAPTVTLFSAGSLLVAAEATWRTVRPPRVDPADYAEHTILATWPAAAGTETWRATGTASDVVVRPEGQTVLCGPSEVSLEAEAPLLRLENNQIFLLPFRTRPSDEQVVLQLFWQSDGFERPAEERSIRAPARLGGWSDVVFRIPAEPSATLTHLRIDTGDSSGLSVKLRRAQITSPGLAQLGLLEEEGRTVEWSCAHDCEVNGDAYRTIGDDPYFTADVEPVSMDFDLRAVVGVDFTGAQKAPTPAKPDAIYGKLGWRRAGDPDWLAENQTDFYMTARSDWTWVRLNPSLFDHRGRWAGELSAVRLVLRCSSYRVVEIGTMKLMKDYRMVGAR